MGLKFSVLFSLALAAAFAQTSLDLDLSHSPMRPYIESFSLDRSSLIRYYPLELDPTRNQRIKRFLTEWRERLSTIDFEAMPQDGKVDYVVFRNYLDHELKKLDLDAISQAETAAYIPFAHIIIELEDTRKTTAIVKPQEAAATLTALTAEIGRTRKSLEQQLLSGGKQSKTVAARAATNVVTLRNTLRSWHAFYDSFDPLFTWWAGDPYTAADTALQSYSAFLRERVAGLATAKKGARAGSTDDIVGNPIGRDGLIAELAFEMIPYTPEELIAIANQEFAWCENEMKRASREMGYGGDWKKALEKVKTMYVEPGKQPGLIRNCRARPKSFWTITTWSPYPPSLTKPGAWR